MEPPTPRMRSAYPATPPRSARDRRTTYNPIQRSSPPTTRKEPLPQIPTLKSALSPPNEPLVPETIVDAPSQRLYAVALWVALWTWRMYDFAALHESEEQSLWLFMKWVAIDGVFLFGLPALRIPWLEWSAPTTTLIFLAHACTDAMLMFRIPVPIGAGLAVLWRGVWGAYETAVKEHHVNPDTVLFNDSLILGRQVIHVLPEGSAVLNPERLSFCLDSSRTEIKLPITINATNPISMDILRLDLETQTNETLHLSRSQIKTMHKDASRLISYSLNPNEPKTLYYSIKKPGLYALARVIDESNLEVPRKKLAHTVVVPCPKAAIMSSDSVRCRGELSNVELQVTGTPPMKVKYRKVVNQSPQEATFENIQPEELVSPLTKQDQSSLVIPNKIDTEWARPRTVRVPLSEGMVIAGKWVYAIDEVSDGFGNVVTYSHYEQEQQERRLAKSPHLHQIITVHERPNVQLGGCTPQQPLKIASGRSAELPLRYGSTGRGELINTPYHLEYLFSPQEDLTSNGEHGAEPKQKSIIVENSAQFPSIKEPGLYTLTGVSTDYCQGDVLEPASCLLQNPPRPDLSIEHEEIFDKCAGSPIGLRVNMDMVGTPPFQIHYRSMRDGERHHRNDVETINGLRGQMVLTPKQAGSYTYEFYAITDSVYADNRFKPITLSQSVKPSASARFRTKGRQVTCIDQKASAKVEMFGEAPFSLEYEIVHGGKRKKHTLQNVTATDLAIETETLRDGGEYTLSLVSITDQLGCKEFLKDETKINVRHQKPKVGFGPIDGRRIVDTLEGKRIHLPLRLAGEGPWIVSYLDRDGKQQRLRATSPNDRLEVDQDGLYELTDVSDNICPGVVDELAKNFEVNWIARPEFRIPSSGLEERKGNTLIKTDVCEGDEDAVEVLFKGAPPFHLSYEQHVRPDRHVAIASKSKELRAAVNVASLRMDTSQAGQYDYRFSKLEDSNYDHSPKHFASFTIQQKVHARPSAAFTNPGKTYSFCSVESEGEEVIPVTLHGQPPFELEVEIKHHGTIKPEILHYNHIPSTTHSIRVPHSRLHLGKSAVFLRRVSDSRGCARTLDSTVPRVQISVHDAPTVSALETQTDYCVGQRLNFGLSGLPPFDIFYTFEGAQHKARVGSGNTFRRLAEKPGTFTITGLQDSASSCRASTNLTKQIHGMPSVRVSKGRDGYVDIHEGGQAEITFDFGGVPPFEFTYTRSSNTEKGGRKPGRVLDTRSEISEAMSLKIFASEEGTYEVVAIKDRHCSYTKPGTKLEGSGERKKLGY